MKTLLDWIGVINAFLLIVNAVIWLGVWRSNVKIAKLQAQLVALTGRRE